MKSPTSKVGIMEPEGILKGSTTKERRKNTARMTGKKLAPYSTHQGAGTPGGRRFRATKRSAAQRIPVATSNTKRIKAKFMLGICCWSYSQMNPGRSITYLRQCAA